MKITNTTDFSNHYLRRMTAWCCRELGMPVRMCRSATFRNSRSLFGGAARHGGGQGRITVCIGPAGGFPWTDNGNSCGIKGIVRVMADRVECLVNVTAHELRHIQAEQEGERTRGSGYRVASSERATEHDAQKVLATFRAARVTLEEEWNVPPVIREAVAKSPQDQRAAKASMMFEAWSRKLKLAQSKVKKYRRRVAYYERVAATRSGGAV